MSSEAGADREACQGVPAETPQHRGPGVERAESEHLGFEPATPDQRGKLWTVVAGLAVFGAILLAVWSYLYPRLTAEPISPEAPIELRAASEQEHEGWERQTALTGRTAFVSPDTFLTAADIKSFRGTYGAEWTPILTLNLTDGGQQRLSAWAATQGGQRLAVLINNRLYAVAAIDEPQSTPMVVELSGVSREDAEEAFARLTQ